MPFWLTWNSKEYKHKSTSSLDIGLLCQSIAILMIKNLRRKGTGFESECILIIISSDLRHFEKEEDGLQVTHTAYSWGSLTPARGLIVSRFHGI